MPRQAGPDAQDVFERMLAVRVGGDHSGYAGKPAKRVIEGCLQGRSFAEIHGMTEHVDLRQPDDPVEPFTVLRPAAVVDKNDGDGRGPRQGQSQILQTLTGTIGGDDDGVACQVHSLVYCTTSVVAFEPTPPIEIVTGCSPALIPGGVMAFTW